MLADFFKADVLDSDNQLECAQCRAMNNSKIRFRLKSRKFLSSLKVLVPRFLIIHMKRFDFSGNKLNNVIDFPETFQFPQAYMNDDLLHNEKTGWTQSSKTSQDLLYRFLNRAEEADTFKTHSYELYGMIVHHGYNAGGGHYYSLVRSSPQ